MEETSFIARLDDVRRARCAAANGLRAALTDITTAGSEREVADRWLAEMKRDPSLRQGGWYEPPPGGVSVLAGNGPDFRRLNFTSLRDPTVWPSDTVALSDGCLLYAYASPVNRHSGMIGDVGVTLYNGGISSIRDHLALCAEITAKIVCHAEVGMELRDVFHYGEHLIANEGLCNETYSVSDPTGDVDLGHTIPWSYCDYAEAELNALRCGSAADVARAVSKARAFVNASQRQRIAPTMAFTVEPRVRSALLPLVACHVIVVFSEGKKQVYGGLGQLLQQFGMSSYLTADGFRVLSAPMLASSATAGK